MSRRLSTEPVAVRIGDCLCPGAPHPDGDVAWLRPRLTARGGLLATTIVNGATDPAKTMTDLSMVFLSDGLVGWNLLDDDGKPIPADEATLMSGSLSWDATLYPLAERAASLYTDSVLRPFRTAKGSPSSDDGSTGTDEPTSATSTS